jgi:UDP-glucose 4-epimerase
VYEPADVAHTESGPLRPVDVYGLSKLWAEQLAQLYWQRDGLNISVGRVFNVYGPGETNPHLIPSLIDQALGGSVILVGNLATSRDYVHVDDVARALVAMGQRKQTPAMLCVNLGSGRAISGARVVETIGRCLGRALETSTEPSRLRQVDRPMLLSDPSLAAELIGWRAQVSFEDGMRDLVRASLAAGTRV